LATVYPKVASSQGFATNQRPLSMWEHLEVDFPELTPLLTFLSRLKMKEVDRHIFYITNDAEVPTTITGMSAATDGDITGADNYSYLQINDELYNPRTKEVIKIITTKPTSSTIAEATLTRGVGATSAGTIIPSDVLHIMSPDYEEGSNEAHSRSVVNTEDYNYTGILQHSIETTGTAAAEKILFEDSILRANRRKLNREYQLKYEAKLWFGTRHQTAGAGGLNSRGFGGIVEFLNAGTNKWAVNGSLTEQGFRSHLVDVWTQHPDNVNVAFFASPQVIEIVQGWGAEKIQTSVNEKMYGYKVSSFKGVFPVDLVPVPMFAQNATTQGWGFLLDTSQFRGAYLRGRAPKLYKEVQDKKADYILDLIRGEVSLYRLNEKRHSMLEGIDS